MEPFTCRIGHGVEMTVIAEDRWEASKLIRQMTRQGYIKRGRFAKSMKPIFMEGMVQLKPGIPITEYHSTEKECYLCSEKMLELNPPDIYATLNHCSSCYKTFVSGRAVDAI